MVTPEMTESYDMVPSEELELKIYRHIEFAGKAQWWETNLGILTVALDFFERSVLIDAIHDLHGRKFLHVRTLDQARNEWRLYDGAERDCFQFFFQLRVTFSGRKYFESLEAKAVEEAAIKTRTANQERADSRLTSSASIQTSQPAAPKAFVSHGSQDHEFVEKFATDLRAYGVDVWYAPWEIKPGDSIRAKIDEGLEGCDFFIIILSRSSINRPWVQTELDAATMRKLSGKVRKIIPIKIDDCGDLPPMLSALCWEDFSSQPYATALTRVLHSILDIDTKPPLGQGPFKITTGGKVPVSEPKAPELPILYPINIHDLERPITQLKSEGFDARADLLNGQVGLLVGPKGLDQKRLPPETAAFFFPLWELNHHSTRPLVNARRFHDIVEARPKDWQYNKPYSRHSTFDRSTFNDQSARLCGPDDVDLLLSVHTPPQGSHGIVAKLHNRRTSHIANCRVIVGDAQSVDGEIGALRDSSQFKPIRVLGGTCDAGFETKGVWFVRIQADHLEVGDTINEGVMHWPTGDNGDRERWRLFVSVASDQMKEWRSQVDLEWVRGSDSIKIKAVETERS